MRFIEIREGVSVDIDQIEVVEKKDDLTSIVYTHHNAYETNFPYMALLQLLEMQGKEGNTAQDETIKNLQETWLKTTGTYAG